MDFKRGILSALGLYFVTLIVGIIITIFAQASLDSVQTMSTTYWVITIISTVVLTSIASLLYFRKAKRNAKEGLKLGILYIIVGFILDLIFFITQSNGFELILEYYVNPSFYIVILLVVVTCVFVGSREDHSIHHHVKHTNNKKHKRK